MWPDLYRWFGPNGLFPGSTMLELKGQNTFSIFNFLPETERVVLICYLIFLMQIVLLLLGFYTRVQAVSTFVWFISFMNENYLIWDGQDRVLSLIGFLLVFLPSGERFSLDAKMRSNAKPGSAKKQADVPIWPLRLIQIQMTLIMLSTALEKLSGHVWQQGTAIYFVTRLDDLSGRFPLPSILTEWTPGIKLASWSVLAVELLVPILIWIPKTRLLALFLVIGLHLSIEYAMNMFLFEWIMIVGWLSFFKEEELFSVKNSYQVQGELT